MAGGVLLQNAATAAGNGTVFDCRGHQGTYLFSVHGSGTVTSGEVTFEHALTTAGPWETVGLPVAPTTDSFNSFSVLGAFRCIRGRISTAIGGGGSVYVRVQPPDVLG